MDYKALLDISIEEFECEMLMELNNKATSIVRYALSMRCIICGESMLDDYVIKMNQCGHTNHGKCLIGQVVEDRELNCIACMVKVSKKQ